jgi:hypothetical protein
VRTNIDRLGTAADCVRDAGAAAQTPDPARGNGTHWNHAVPTEGVTVAVSGLTALLTSVLGALLVLLTVALIYTFGWRKAPEVSFEPDSATGRQTELPVPTRHGGRMYESDVPEHETESVGHDVFDPVGTLALLAVYFVVVGLAWLFMYFVEFLGNGPTVVG